MVAVRTHVIELCWAQGGQCHGGNSEWVAIASAREQPASSLHGIGSECVGCVLAVLLVEAGFTRSCKGIELGL